MTFDPYPFVRHCDVAAAPLPATRPGYWVCQGCGVEFEARALAETGTTGRTSAARGKIRHSPAPSIFMACMMILHAANGFAQPLVQASDVSLVGTWQIPPDDGRGILLTYGGAMGVAEDGKSFYWSCVYGSGIARLSIPAIGGTAQVLEPCQGMQTFLGKITPTDPNPDVIGGILAQGGRLTVSGYNTYDGAHEATLSHGVGTSLASITQPYQLAGVNKAGIVSGWMTPIPAEWQGPLGGTALTGQSGISIISRSSHGPVAYAFDPAGLGSTPYPGKLLLGYPHGQTNVTLGDYDRPGPGFSGATRFAGMALPSGTRSLLYFGRHGINPADYCYGTGTPDRSLHGKLVGGGPHKYCYDPTNFDQGTHGYPYQHQAWAYDVNDLLAVKAGTRTPQSLLPYAMFRLPGTSDNAVVNTGAYNAVTGEFYAHWAQSSLTVHVYKIAAGAPPPPPPTLTVDLSGMVRTCEIRLSANKPPTAETGWGIQFLRQRNGGAWVSHGSRDANGADGWTRGPYTVAKGEWRAQGLWTRAGSLPVTVAGTLTYRCE